MLFANRIPPPKPDIFENIIQDDPTLKLILREKKFDYDLLIMQVNIKCATLSIALHKFIQTL